MDWYAVPISCPRCSRSVKITQVAINAAWELGVNISCKCGHEVGLQFNLIELVQAAQKSDAMEMQ